MRKLDSINNTIVSFCQYFDREISMIKDKNRMANNLSNMGVTHIESRPQTDDKKFEIVNNKINML